MIIQLILWIPIFLASLISMAGVAEYTEKPLGTGLRNHENNCYMNALFSCLHDLTPFRNVLDIFFIFHHELTL